MNKKIYILTLLIVLFIGCGETTVDDGVIILDNTSQDNQIDNNISINTQSNILSDSNLSLKIKGKITYDRVHANRNGIGLDYNNITKESAKQIIVKLIDSNNREIATTTTNDNGEYEFDNISSNQTLRVEVYAKMRKEGQGGWDLRVVDNTNSNSLYVITSSNINLNDKSLRIDLNANSGWTGDGYTKERNSAPFAILDTLYKAIKKVKSADNNVTFPKLIVNWSIYNIASPGSKADGQIETSHYDGEELYILGDENSDTDEFDDHIMLHEWGHYFEAKFSRADSIGGPHGEGDVLDIRVSFGEGWGNAWSAIASDNPIYFDTQGFHQSDGFSINIENATPDNPGWFSEASIHRILYDLYDSNNDGADRLSMGFKPIYKVLVGSQKDTSAFTSIFTFIKALEEQNSQYTTQIDDILISENISHISSIYGDSDYNLYTDYSGDGINVCTSTKYGYFNKLYNHRYIKFAIFNSGDYTIKVEQSDGDRSDPDFFLYKTSPFNEVAKSDNIFRGLAQERVTLSPGNYLLDISDYNNLPLACFNITIN